MNYITQNLRATYLCLQMLILNTSNSFKTKNWYFIIIGIYKIGIKKVTILHSIVPATG